MARNIQSLERAAAMLRLLAGGERRLGLSEIASALGLAKGTAHGILRTLQAEGFVEQDSASGRYQLGAELLRLGNSYLDVHELRARALVWTDDLARSSGESVYLGRPAPAGRADRAPRLPAGRQPPGAGGGGDAAAALHGPGQGARRVRPGGAQRGRRRPSWQTPSPRAPSWTPTAFEGVLDLTRARGYAADVEETWEGIASVAAPIHDRRRMPVGAVGITGAVERVCEDGELRPELIAAVRDCARAVSRDLGAGRF